jgi:hypothetical protein
MIGGFQGIPRNREPAWRFSGQRPVLAGRVSDQIAAAVEGVFVTMPAPAGAQLVRTRARARAHHFMAADHGARTRAEVLELAAGLLLA